LQRFLSTGLVLGLLIATAAAFAITEGLKLTQSPITRTRVDKVVSPERTAHIRFWLRKPDTLTLTVVNSGRHEVRELVTDAPASRRWNTFVWNGRTDTGSVAKDGAYYARVHLLKAHRTILLPNKIELDTGVPQVGDAKANRAVFSPDGDGQSDSIKIHYTLSERAHALLYVRGRQLVRTRFSPVSGSLTWYGRVNGVALPQGTYRLRVGAEDPASNVTPAAERRVVVVRIRYIELARRAIEGITAGTRFGVGVDTEAKSYSWRLGSRSGTSRSRLLVVRAPTTAGRYRLVVTENGHRASASVVVAAR
jgi:hypothetical protein